MTDIQNTISIVLEGVGASIEERRELEYFRIHQDRYNRVVNEILDMGLPKGSRILDVGCYPPHMFKALKELGFDMYGISSSHEPVKNKHVIISNIETDKLPFQPVFFDLIICSEVMEHLIVSPLIYLEKFRRVLKKNGRLLITTPNAAGLHKRIPLMLGRSSYFPLTELYNTKPGDGSVYHRHNREFTIDELCEVVEKAGFTVQKQTTIGVYGPFRKKLVQHPLPKRVVRGIAFFLTKLYSPFQDTLLLIAGLQKR